MPCQGGPGPRPAAPTHRRVASSGALANVQAQFAMLWLALQETASKQRGRMCYVPAYNQEGLGQSPQMLLLSW